jgi:hypothetical protein
MENEKCLLCDSPVKSKPFSATPDSAEKGGGSGGKYDCKICGSYALSVNVYTYIENYCTREERFQLS